MKNLSIALAFCFLGLCPSQDQTAPPAPTWNAPDLDARAVFSIPLPEIQHLGAGSYLSSRFAQQNHDWKNANTYIATLMQTHAQEKTILERAMILAMGAGEYPRALELAKKIDETWENKSPTEAVSLTVARLFLAAEAISQNKPKEAKQFIDKLPNDSTANFVKPFLIGWNAAAEGRLQISNLKENTMQLYHAILISDFLNDHTELEKMLGSAIVSEQNNPADMERIADLYAHAGLKQKALDLYNKVQKEWPDETLIGEKILAVEQGTNKPLFEKVTSINVGMATAFYDIASALYQDYNDESARIFGTLALMLAPEMTEPKFLIAQIGARHNQYGEAIRYYEQIPQSDKNYITAQFKIAELQEDSGNPEAGLSTLLSLEKSNNNVDVQINLGDYHRRQKDFTEALNAYNTALKMLGDPMPPEYWNLHYALGICYEQTGDWKAAERELKAALEMNPDHPHVLNYLGYGWADQGVNLDEALEMIRRAAELRPQDGYIVDSLGWVLFKREAYHDSVPYLEKAVALLPYDPTINDHLGDAYWKVGRHREARFQWLRAKNHADEEKQIQAISSKLANGLTNDTHRVGENSISQ